MFGAGQAGPRTAPGGGGEPDIEDLLRMFGGQGGGFGGGGPAGFSPHRAPTKGSDISARTKLSFRDAALGTDLKLTVDGRSVTFAVEHDHMNTVMSALTALGVHSLVSNPPSLEELFMRHYGDELAGPNGNGGTA